MVEPPQEFYIFAMTAVASISASYIGLIVPSVREKWMAKEGDSPSFWQILTVNRVGMPLLISLLFITFFTVRFHSLSSEWQQSLTKRISLIDVSRKLEGITRQSMAAISHTLEMMEHSQNNRPELAAEAPGLFEDGANGFLRGLNEAIAEAAELGILVKPSERNLNDFKNLVEGTIAQLEAGTVPKRRLAILRDSMNGLFFQVDQDIREHSRMLMIEATEVE